jgi:hypothetical protein
MVLGQKADREQIDILQKNKQNKIDSEMIKDVQIIMAKMFKQILVLFAEIVNCQTAKVNESKLMFEKRLDDLINQVQTLSKWILNFDPHALMNPSDVNTIPVMNGHDEKMFNDFSIGVFKNLDKF